MAAFFLLFSFSDRDIVLVGVVDRNVDRLVIQQVPQEGRPSAHTQGNRGDSLWVHTGTKLGVESRGGDAEPLLF